MLYSVLILSFVTFGEHAQHGSQIGDCSEPCPRQAEDQRIQQPSFIVCLDPVALDLDPEVVAPDLAEARGDAAAKLARFCYGDCRKLCHRKQTK